ncbi:hypothetical protein N7478_001376 [Penicillium angulare]|uniref:uncharacterized protein n=1 Tax=Penicillium angulare TaxID=116970 RepID=UPI0025415E51|nr:uncharacterized protein N7478_001376 [Penicillium angulare]KAJ5292125.1 hypothetical protein N7478_001376 [Penicillium angulare]
MLDSDVNGSDYTPAILDTSASRDGLTGSSKIIRGFSASQVSSSKRLHAPAVDVSPIAGYTVPSEADTTEKTGQPFTLKGSSWDDQSSPSGSLDAVTKARLHRYSSECLTQSCSRSKAASLDVAVELMTIKPSKEGTSNDDSATESKDDPDSLLNNNYCPSDWEDMASKSGVSSVDEKELFPWADLWPSIVSPPSLLSAMIYEASPLTVHPAKAIRTGQSRLSPALQRLCAPPNGPSLTSSQDRGYQNTLIRSGLDIPYSKLGTHTPSCSVAASPKPTSPKPTPEDILVDEVVDEVNESLRCHLQWERQQQSTTIDAVLNRQHKLNITVDLKECPFSLKCNNESQKYGQSDNVAPDSPMETGQSHENNVRNHYFDGDI